MDINQDPGSGLKIPDPHHWLNIVIIFKCPVPGYGVTCVETGEILILPILFLNPDPCSAFLEKKLVSIESFF
jgi:hypothetical protein